MISMTFGDDTEEAWRLRDTAAAEETGAEAENAWTPAMARFVATIGRALESFPEALAAVQAAIAGFGHAPG